MTNRWAVLALIMAAQIMVSVGPLGIPSIALLIRENLGLSVTQAGSFLSAYYIGSVLISLPAGWLADRWGVRGAMVLGQALIAIGLSPPRPRRASRSCSSSWCWPAPATASSTPPPPRRAWRGSRLASAPPSWASSSSACREAGRWARW